MLVGFKSVRRARQRVKHIRITARVAPDSAPGFVAYLLRSPAVTEARAVDWNRADAETTTHLYAVDGDA